MTEHRRRSRTSCSSRLVFLVGPVILPLSLIYWLNYKYAIGPMRRFTKGVENPALEVRVRFRWYANPNQLVYDVRGVRDGTTADDAFEFLARSAATFKKKKYKQVLLVRDGETKYILAGEYFSNLALEYPKLEMTGKEKPGERIKKAAGFVGMKLAFPRALETADGKKAFPERGINPASLSASLKDYHQAMEAWLRMENEK